MTDGYADNNVTVLGDFLRCSWSRWQVPNFMSGNAKQSEAEGAALDLTVPYLCVYKFEFMRKGRVVKDPGSLLPTKGTGVTKS